MGFGLISCLAIVLFFTLVRFGMPTLNKGHASIKYNPLYGALKYLGRKSFKEIPRES